VLAGVLHSEPVHVESTFWFLICLAFVLERTDQWIWRLDCKSATEIPLYPELDVSCLLWFWQLPHRLRHFRGCGARVGLRWRRLHPYGVDTDNCVSHISKISSYYQQKKREKWTRIQHIWVSSCLGKFLCSSWLTSGQLGVIHISYTLRQNVPNLLYF